VINPTDYKIINAYPNPFNGAITIDLILSHGSNKIFIYDLLGHMQYKKEIQGLHSNEYSIQWQPDNQASGIYFIKISNSQLENVKKITYLK
ncbi:MAG: T9SS type A sorting domain-containing protein, partial [bacterium]